MAMIDIINVSLSMQEKKVLNSISLTINRGESHVIVGPSGAGKSSIIKIICGLWKPQKGIIKISKTDITNLSEKEIIPFRRKIGIVFQGNALFDSLTVEENVAFFLHEHNKLSDDEIDARVSEALSIVNMQGTENLNIDQLSGGMKRRVAIARALAFRPEIILYDEPTTGLDPINSKSIIDLINKVKEYGATSVVVTHILDDALAVADKMTVINDGAIIESGSISQILNSQNKFIQKFFSGVYQASDVIHNESLKLKIA